MRILIIAVALVATPVSAASEQFDLQCRGQNRASPAGVWRPVEKHYRVDLAAKRWCQDRCAAVADIAVIERDKIIFRDQPRKFDTDGMVIESVDRISGAWKDNIVGAEPNGLYWESTGTCEAGPFSGFPEVKTKF